MDRFRNTRQPDWGWWGKLWPTPGWTLRQLGIAADDSVAEVGSGNGYFALPLARIVAPAPVYALDVDESLLAALTGLAERQGIENVTAVTGDARSLTTHLPEAVDTVLIANTFHGVEETGTVVRQAHESLADGGRFVVVNWRAVDRDRTLVAGEPRGPPTELRLSPADTDDAVLDAAAFTHVRTIELPPYHYGAVFER